MKISFRLGIVCIGYLLSYFFLTLCFVIMHLFRAATSNDRDSPYQEESHDSRGQYLRC